MAGILEGLLLLSAMLACYALVYATGGCKYVYSHLMYFPVIVAGFRYGIKGGVLVGAIAGILLGPIMPISIDSGEQQLLANWLVRLFILTGIGAIIGLFAQGLQNKNRELTEGELRTSITLKNVLAAMVSVIEGKDGYTRWHCKRVAHNAYALGRIMGLPAGQLVELHWSGLLHDLGKVWVPQHILNKPGKLTAEEYEEIKAHPVKGAAILRDLTPTFRDMAETVRHHHERWDGKGYPDGLSQQDIPLHARILTVADVFEALTSDRPYREAMKTDKAISLIRSMSEIHFDPLVVQAFDQALDNGNICLEKSQPFWSNIPMDLDPDALDENC